MQRGTSTVEPYNAVLYSRSAMDNCDISLLMDNDALFHHCANKLDLDRVSFNDLNHLIAQIVSSTTVFMRFDHNFYPVNVEMKELQTNLVPFPRIRHLLTTLGPIASPERVRKKSKHFWLSRSILDSYLFRQHLRA